MEFDLFAEAPGTSPTAPTINQLILNCPVRFKSPSDPWNVFASKCYRAGANGDNWIFKNPDNRDRQMECFIATAAGARLAEIEGEGRAAVAVVAWMLHEMLVDVPKYIPRSKL